MTEFREMWGEVGPGPVYEVEPLCDICENEKATRNWSLINKVTSDHFAIGPRCWMKLYGEKPSTVIYDAKPEEKP